MTATELNWQEDCAAECGAGRWAVGNDGVLQYSTPIGDLDIEVVAERFRSAYSDDQAERCDVTVYIDGIRV